MKKILSITALALAAGLFSVSCEKQPDTQVTGESIYLTTGLPVSNEVYYSITTDELTGKTDTVGTNEITLKLCSATEVRTAVAATLKADFGKLPSNAARMPEEGYSLVRTAVEIAAGAKEGTETFLVTINADAMPEAGIYALPLTIEATSDNTEVSTGANTVIIRFIRNIEKLDVPDGLKKISSDRYTVVPLEGCIGYEYEGETVAAAFDGDLSTFWYAEALQYQTDESGNYVFDDNGYALYDCVDDADSWGCFAEVVFTEPVALKSILVAADEDSDYYRYRPHRLSIMFKYEDDEEYNWDKAYDWNGDEDIYSGAYLGEGVSTWPDYKPSPADFVISEYAYTQYSIDLTEKIGDKKVASMIIAPARFWYYQSDWSEDLNDYTYEAYYDLYTGVCSYEFILFE